MTDVRYLVTIGPDYGAECPNDWEQVLKVVSFNPRHRDHRDASNVEMFKSRADAYASDGMPIGTIDGDPIVYLLDCFEHGAIRWYRATGRDYQFDPGGWDTSHNAGALILSPSYTAGGDSADYWAGLTAAEREECADATLEEWNAWSNGEVYAVTIETNPEPVECDRGHDHIERELIDSCSGIYDVKDYVAEVIGLGLDDEHVTVKEVWQ